MRFEIRDVQNQIKTMKIRKKVEKLKFKNDYVFFEHIRHDDI